MRGRNALVDVAPRTVAGLAWTPSGRPAPAAAGAALHGLLWAAFDEAAPEPALSPGARSDMRCWALQTARAILGWRRGGRSYVAGYGARAPRRPQHRLAACGAPAAAACSVLSPAPNAVELAGALVAGPAEDGSFADARARSEQSAVGLHHNAPLIGLLAGLLASGTRAGECAAGHGLFQLLGAARGALP